jgi:hypothetical protein
MQCINNSCKESYSGVRRVNYGMRGVGRGFYEIQQVNHMPLLLSYNYFECLQVNTLIQLKINNIKCKEVIQTTSYPPIPN